MRIKIKRLISLLFLNTAFNAVAQINADRIDNLKNVVPPSPNASSLGKYGEWPISLYTGLPNVSIPIYELKGRSLSVPISLSYHAAGNKVGDIASWVGLGWNLNTGGIISRSIRGWPDDDPSLGYFTKRQLYTNQNDLCSSPVNIGNATQHKVASAKGEADSEQDLYSFNALGRSFKFFFKADGTIVPTAYSKVKITTNYLSLAAPPENINWTATFEDGTKLQFGGLNCFEINSNPRFYIGTTYFVTSWLLKSITSADGEVISFTYTGSSVSQDSYFSQSDFLKYKLQTISSGIGSCPEYIESYTDRSKTEMQQVTMLSVSTIESQLARVEFELNTTDRLDLKGSKALSAVKIFSKTENKYTEKYQFNYTYSQAVTSNEFWGGVVEADKDYYRKRLKLTSVEKSTINSVVDNKWVFNYNSLALPSRRSFAQDHWGFYNGAVGNNTLLPKYLYPLPANILQTYSNAGFNLPTYKAGASREGDGNYSQAEILQSIEYPTGGKTTFYFEANSIPGTEEVFSNATASAQLNLNSLSNPFTTFQEQTFTITKAQNVLLSLDSYISSGIFNDVPNTSVSATVRKSGSQTSIAGGIVSSGSGISQYNGTSRFNIIDPGTYILKISTNAQQVSFGTTDAIIASAYLQYEQSQGLQNVNKSTGGLRLKKMVDYDGADPAKNVEKNFIYENPLIISPVDIKELYFTENEERTCDEQQGLVCDNKIITRNSSTKFSLGDVQGGTVGYGKVTTLYGANGMNGKTITEFTNENDYGLSEAKMFPYPSADSRDWRRGLALKQTDYTASAVKLKETVNTYDFIQKGATASFKAGIFKTYPPPVNGCAAYGCIDIYGDCSIQKICYNTISEQLRSLSSVQTIYDQNGLNPLTTTTTNFYDNPDNLQPVRIETVNSKGQTIKVISRTPLEKTDINNATTLTTQEAAAIDELVNRNIISPVLQTEQYKSGNLITRSLITYKNWGGLILKPEKMKIQQGVNPIENRIRFTGYDNLGNLLEQQKENDSKQSYIYDYYKTYPICQVINSDTLNIAYTSFEADGKGNWSFTGTLVADNTSPTGKRAYSLINGSITKLSLDIAKTYIVSYWSKNGPQNVNSTIAGTGRSLNGWTYYEHKIVNPAGGLITVSGTGTIDELRLYPDKALMTTYTYDPLIGVTSQCDANNRISYYEYNDFNKLVLIRDQDKNILKKICYNNAGQPENCNGVVYSNIAMSQIFTRNNCAVGYTGSTVTYSVAAGTYTSTISQADADAQALAAINANGQNYANTNGTCTSGSGCSPANCTGNNKKCINGVCQTGIRVCTDSWFNSSIGQYVNTFHYEWSDGSWSQNYTEYSDCNCYGHFCI